MGHRKDVLRHSLASCSTIMNLLSFILSVESIHEPINSFTRMCSSSFSTTLCLLMLFKILGMCLESQLCLGGERRNK